MSVELQNQSLAEDDFPAFFLAADTASRSAQKMYLGLVATTISLQIFGVCLALMKPSSPPVAAFLAGGSAVLFALSIVTSVVLKVRKYDKVWYGARAAAESVKSMAWQYATRNEPYADMESADGLFVTNLKAVFDERKQLAYAIGPGLPDAQQITPRMRQLRQLPILERRNVYLMQRIKGQKGWYAHKAVANKHAESRLFWLFVCAQMLAFVAALWRLRSPEITNFTGLFAAIATSAMAWLQTKKHQEQAQAYSVAAHELSLIEARAESIKDDLSLSRFVGDAETAISREHTLWVARRDDV
jgi:hypothetical protein